MGGRATGGVTRPKHVKIGHMRYHIEWLSEDQWQLAAGRQDWGGDSEHERGRIRLRITPGRSEASLRETLLHEITHAVWVIVGLNHFPHAGSDDEVEESVITRQSPTLLQTLQDNPHVVAYLVLND